MYTIYIYWGWGLPVWPPIPPRDTSRLPPPGNKYINT